MYPVTITSGGNEVLATGTVIGYSAEPTIIKINVPDFLMVIHFNFVDSSSSETSELKASVNEDQELVLTFLNFQSSLSTGNTQPIHIGHYDKRRIFINYRITALTEGSGKLIYYTFYLEGGEK